jgi:hypothetical protein
VQGHSLALVVLLQEVSENGSVNVVTFHKRTLEEVGEGGSHRDVMLGVSRLVLLSSQGASHRGAVSGAETCGLSYNTWLVLWSGKACGGHTVHFSQAGCVDVEHLVSGTCAIQQDLLWLIRKVVVVVRLGCLRCTLNFTAPQVLDGRRLKLVVDQSGTIKVRLWGEWFASSTGMLNGQTTTPATIPPSGPPQRDST